MLNYRQTFTRLRQLYNHLYVFEALPVNSLRAPFFSGLLTGKGAARISAHCSFPLQMKSFRKKSWLIFHLLLKFNNATADYMHYEV
jgi:hypothetical protein